MGKKEFFGRWLLLLVFVIAGRTCWGQTDHDKDQWKTVFYNIGTVFGEARFYSVQYELPPGGVPDSVTLYDCERRPGEKKFKRSANSTPRRLKYWSGKESSLYDQLKKGVILENVIIDTLDLTRMLADSDYKADKKLIDFRYPLQFSRCIIRTIRYPDKLDLQDEPRSTADTSYAALFSKKVAFVNTYIGENQVIKASFVDTLFVYNVLTTTFGFEESHFLSACILGCRISDIGYKNQYRDILYGGMDVDTSDFIGGITIDDKSTFEGDLYIRNTTKSMHIAVNNSYINGRIYLGEYLDEWHGRPLINKQHSRATADSVVTIDLGHELTSAYLGRHLNNTDVSSCTFRNKFSLRNSSAVNLNVEDCRFFDTLDLYNNVRNEFDTSTDNPAKGYSGTYFLKNNIVLVNIANFKIDSLPLNNSSIREVSFIYPLHDGRKDYHLTEDTLQQISDFYDGCIAWMQNRYQKEAELSTELTARYKHIKTMYAIKYYRTNFSIGNFFAFIWYSFLEFLVGNGYHGESRFFWKTCWVILGFALVYFIFFKKDIGRLMDPADEASKPDAGEEKPAKTQPLFQTFVKCVWTSVVILISPKYSKDYFDCRPAFFVVLTLEWIIGVLFVVLFLVYIASNYPFIKTLVGL